MLFDRGCYLFLKFLLSMACFPSNLIVQSAIVYVSVFVLMFDKLFPQFMLLFYRDNGFVIKF